MIGEIIAWMICHSDCTYLHQRLLHGIIIFFSQSNEDSYHYLYQKNLNIPFWQIYQYLKLRALQKLYYTTTIVLHYLALQNHRCIVTCAALLKNCP